MINNNIFLIFFFIILPINAFSAPINPYNNYKTAAVVEHAPSLFYNPAGIGLIQDFNIYLNLSYIESKNVNTSIAFSFFLGGFGYENFEKNNKKYKIYNFTIPCFFNFYGQKFYFGLSNKWYTINKSHPYTFGLGFLTYFLKHFSLGLVFDNLTKKEIYYDNNTHNTLKKYSLGMALLKNRIILSIENVHRDKFYYDKNIYQISFEPLLGLILDVTYFDLPNEKKLFSGFKIQFPNLGFKYYNSNKYTHNHNYELNLHSKKYKTFFCLHNKVTEIKISGLLTDIEQFSFLGDISIGAQKILENLNKCYNDDSIKGIILNIGNIQTTSYGGIGGLVYEIREMIVKLRDKKKYIIAYLETGGSTEEYFLASAANRIIISPYASLDELGVSIKVLKLKGLLNRFGINFEIMQSGKNKNTINPFSDQINDEQLKKIKNSVEDLYNLFVKTISQSRYITEEEVKDLINSSPVIDSKTLKENNWIDWIGYEDKAYDTMAALLNKNRISFFDKVNINSIDYLRKEWREGPIIAIVSVSGPIITGESIFNPIYGNLATGADSVIKQLKDIEGNPHIKGIILRIDSPGGSVIASDKIYEQILKLKKEGKFVIASLGSMAASGGYYIACGADYIISTPYTITGSIGVFTMKLELSEAFKKFDITSTTVKKGKYADIFAFDKKSTEEEKKKMQKALEKIHKRFKDIIHKNRGIEYEKLDKIADGSIYTGNQAKDLNLIDELGGLSSAINKISNKFDLDEPFILYYWKDTKSFSPIKLGTSLISF